MAEEKVEEKKKTVKNAKRNYIFAVGRRREAVARVRLYANGGKVEIDGVEYKKGDTLVNGKSISDYFRFVAYKPEYNKVFRDADIEDKFVISIRVTGGGLSGQLDAVVHGIARVLEKFDAEKYREILREKGYLTRDARTRERRKVGMGGKARRKRQSPKR